MPLWGWFVSFAIIMIAVFSVFGLGIKAVSFLSGNDYYVSDTFFMSAVPYVGIAGFIWFLYAIFEEND